MNKMTLLMVNLCFLELIQLRHNGMKTIMELLVWHLFLRKKRKLSVLCVNSKKMIRLKIRFTQYFGTTVTIGHLIIILEATIDTHLL